LQVGHSIEFTPLRNDKRQSAA